MRIANLSGRLVVITGDRGREAAHDVEKNSNGRFGADPQAAYETWDSFAEWAAGEQWRDDGIPVSPGDLGSPAPSPRQVLAIGLNYQDHAAESGFAARAGEPPVFTKFPSCITGPHGDIALPEGGHTDWEVELVAVIGRRAPGVLAAGQVMPRKLGHAVLGTTDFAATQAFFVAGLGFKVSDYIKGAGAFLRCSTDHHNVLVLSAPVSFLHHTSWQVDDIDEVGRGAHTMLEDHPERHVWGLGRHYGGSNFFWYLKDPAGNFSEYYSDMDCIVDDQLWTPEDLEGARSLYAWGPPPPPSFLHPDDLAAMMTGAHRVP